MPKHFAPWTASFTIPDTGMWMPAGTWTMEDLQKARFMTSA